MSTVAAPTEWVRPAEMAPLRDHADVATWLWVSLGDHRLPTVCYPGFLATLYDFRPETVQIARICVVCYLTD